MARNKFTTAPGCAVQTVERNARLLVTIGPEHPFWALESGEAMVLAEPVEGALVRVQPPPGSTQARVDALNEALRASGATAIRVSPWAKEALGAVQSRVHVHERAQVREVVQEMGQAREQYAPGLCAVLDEVLTEAGL
jgi:hypothetical protein